MDVENQINYVEIPANDLPREREFLTAMFGWQFKEWGDDYLSFNDGRIEGGIRGSDVPPAQNGVLLIFYSEDLERDYKRVQELGASISEEIFQFPGGRRFHFIDPVGNEMAIWSSTGV